MAYKEVSRVDIAEVIRRWQIGNSQRHIAAGTGLSRATVRKYLAAAEKVGVYREGPAPTEEQLSLLAPVSRGGPRQAHAPTDDLLAPWGDQVYSWLMEDRLQVTRIQELLGERGCRVSYTSLRRFIQRRNWRGRNPPDCAHGGESPRSGCGAGLREDGLHPRPGQWPPPPLTPPDEATRPPGSAPHGSWRSRGGRCGP